MINSTTYHARNSLSGLDLNVQPNVSQEEELQPNLSKEVGAPLPSPRHTGESKDVIDWIGSEKSNYIDFVQHHRLKGLYKTPESQEKDMLKSLIEFVDTGEIKGTVEVKKQCLEEVMKEIEKLQEGRIGAYFETDFGPHAKVLNAFKIKLEAEATQPS